MEQTNTTLQSGLKKLYGTEKILLSNQKIRIQKLELKHQKYFGTNELDYFSTPGRIEISGNHTDHNNGKVLAASIDLDSIAVAAKNSINKIVLYSDGYVKPFIVDIHDLSRKEHEVGTTNALVRGLVSRFQELGVKIEGLNICMSSNVLKGSGLSSSASFEILLGTILNSLYGEKKSPQRI